MIFIKRVNNICHTYDWKYIDEHGYPVVDVLKDEDYYLKCKWSAYNFLFMDGPSPLSMIFNFKKLTFYKLSTFYLQHFVAKLCNDLLACIIKAYFGKKVTLTYTKCELGLMFKLQSIPIILGFC